MLAEAALDGPAPVGNRDLQNKVLGRNIALKAPNDAVYRLRLEIRRDHPLRRFSKVLIRNHRSAGYSLEIPASDIRIVGSRPADAADRTPE